MVYSSIQQLPKTVQESLPEDAQEIYKRAFNGAFDQYGEEQTAHKVAWSAVKKSYRDAGERWVKKRG